MTDYKKISKALLIAGALVFASFYSLDVAKAEGNYSLGDSDSVAAFNQDLGITDPKNENKDETTKRNFGATIEKLSPTNSMVDHKANGSLAGLILGAVESERKIKDEDDYNKQKEEYDNARKNYDSLIKEYQSCIAKGGDNCDELKQKVDAEKLKVDESYIKMTSSQDTLNDHQSLTDLGQFLHEKEGAYESLKQQYDEAQAACEHSKGLTAKKVREAEMAKYCDKADQLSQKVKDAEAVVAMAQRQYEKAKSENDKKMAERDQAEHRGQTYLAISTNQSASGDTFDGTYIGTAPYENTGDIFTTMTRRAMRILVGLKPIVYTFAGFGLIGFAWMAIFNKISWKWFANIAMGLFLVANMGRFIEYFVFPSHTESDGIVVVSSAELAFGDHLSDAYADTKYAWVDEVTPYLPPKITKDEAPDVSQPAVEETPEEKAARGFCKAENPGGGLFGGGGFTSCIKDIIAAGKKAVDVVKQVQDGVDSVKTVVKTAQFAGDNIKNIAKNIGKGASIEDIFYSLGEIGQNINMVVGATGGAMNSLVNNISNISNDFQDMGLSREAAAANEAIRSSGGSTNKFDAFLKGQRLDENGDVERTADGNIATTGGIGGWLNNAVDKSNRVNATLQDATDTIASGVGRVANFNTGVDGVGALNDAYRGKQQDRRDAAVATQKAQNNVKNDLNGGTMTSQSQYNKAVSAAETAETDARNKQDAANRAQNTLQEEIAELSRIEEELKDAKARGDTEAVTRLEEQKKFAELDVKSAQNKYDLAKGEADRANGIAKEKRDEASGLRAAASEERRGDISSTREQVTADLNAGKDMLEAEAQNPQLPAKQEAYDKADKQYNDALQEYQDLLDEQKAIKGDDSLSEKEKKKKLKKLQNEIDDKLVEAAKLRETRDEKAKDLENYEDALADARDSVSKNTILLDELDKEEAKLTLEDKYGKSMEQLQEDDKKQQKENAELEQYKHKYGSKDTTVQQEYEELLNKSNKAENAASAAEMDANVKYNEQQQAQNDYLAAQDEVKQLQEDIERARKRGDAEAVRNLEAQLSIARQKESSAKTKYQYAQDDYNTASQKADELRKEADVIRKEAVSKGIESAADTYSSAEEIVKNADVIIGAAQDEVGAKQTALDAAKQELQDAIDAANASGKKEDYDKIAALQTAVDNAEQELYNSRVNLSNTEKDVKKAKDDVLTSKVKQAELEAERDTGLTADELEDQRQAQNRQDEERARLRENFAKETTPSAIARAAETRAVQAQNDAIAAKSTAESKKRDAIQAEKRASEAEKRAAETGDPTDQRIAEKERQRADIAARDAEEAAAAVGPLEAEAEALANSSREASLNEARYLQTYYKGVREQAEEDIIAARALISNLQTKLHNAEAEANSTMLLAMQENTTETIVAAQAAAQRLTGVQNELNQAQTNLDDKIRQRNDAEKGYYDAVEAEKNLTGK